tara:strand:- start:455 stop:826 length:372 start_codon:yes stop_codon:yes gene_type:complete
MSNNYEVEVSGNGTVEVWRSDGKFHCAHGPAVRNIREDIEDVYYLHGKLFPCRATWMDALRYDAVLQDLQNAQADAEANASACDYELSEIEQAHTDAVVAQVSADTALVRATCALKNHKRKNC